MRKLPAAAQEERRRQVVGLRQRGLTYREIAEQVGLSRTGVIDICQRFAAEGTKGLVSKPRGRKPDEQRLLDAAQEAELQKLLAAARRTSWACRLRSGAGRRWGCWSPASARSSWRCARWASTWRARGFTAQKPIRRAYEQDPAAVRRWLRREYPAIVARARQARGIIFWGDETGLRWDDVRGRGYAPRGRTPLVRVCHKRASLSLISAVTNRGELRRTIVDGAVYAPTLYLLPGAPDPGGPPQGLPHPGRLTGAPCPSAAGLARRAQRQDQVYYLPSYSPDLNPDEGVTP